MSDSITDFGVLSPPSCKAARKLLAISQEDLAALAGISISSVRRFESGQHFGAYPRKRILEALEKEGLSFIRPPVERS